MQQINLYQPMFRQQKKVFSAVTMLQILGFFVVVLGAVYGWNVSRLEPFRGELKKTSAEFERLAGQIDRLRASAKDEAETRLLDREIARLSRVLAQRRLLLDALREGSFGNTGGFSAYLEALARGHVAGAWLTDIRIDGGGQQLSLGGSTVDPELVPVYLKRLGEAPAFRQRGFNILELARGESGTAVTFNIATGG
jgi:hypothetical protein